MKNGIIEENGELIYYKNDHPYHAGVIEIDGDIYYAGTHGRIATGYHIVHGEMSNGLLKRGTYKFDENGKLIKNSYIAPKKSKGSHKKSKKRSKSKEYKKRQKIYIGVISAVMAVLLVTVVILKLSTPPKTSEKNHSKTNAEVILPTFDEPVLLCSEQADGLYHNKYTMADMTGPTPYRAFEFEYSITGENGLLKLSEYANMKNSTEYVLSATEKAIKIDNLKTGTTYYYLAEVGEDKYTGSFTTAEGTRYIYIPGVYNTRDIGGYKTADGKTVKQGKIIRGTEIDGLVEPRYYLPKENIDDVLNEFGFVYDMDLREVTIYPKEYKSHFGDSVKHNLYSAFAYGNVFNINSKEPLKEIFSDLATPQNYPMYMHCTYGLDGTGTVVYLLQGILNMSDEDKLREFQMSGFFNPEYATATYMNSLIDGLEMYSGNTTNEKIESFLIDEIGVTAEEIASIREILLED